MPDDSFRFDARARLRIWLAPILLQIGDFVRDIADDMPLLTRIASHVGLLIVIVLTIVLSGVQINPVGASNHDVLAQNGDNDLAPILDPMPDEDPGVFRSPIPLTNVPKRVRRDVIKYAVQPGDSISEIADQFEVSADSILWANPKLEDNPDMLSVGQMLNVPPVTGVLYTVQSGDTVQKIADKFKTKKTSAEMLAQNIVEFEFNKENHELKAPDFNLTVGQALMVPGGYKPYQPRVVVAYTGPIPANAARGTGHFGWPVSGYITQKFWTRHQAIDVGAPKGTPVLAADSGYVTTAGWSTVGYGFMILINHGNGYLTRYAHLSAMNAEVGESVKKGQMIGRVGSTGNSTGPHLHFEIIQASGHRNPLLMLGK